MAERLQKIIREWGVASRRQAEQLILDGQVRVNGDVAVLGQSADPAFDRIEVNGKVLANRNRPELIYLLLNKPRGVVSTCSDPRGRRTILDCFSHEMQQGYGIHPVGRLDTDSTGAIVVTNDGELTFALTHPRHEISKTYEVWVEGQPTERTLQHWRQGVLLEGQKTLPARVEVFALGQGRTKLQIVLWEGRNRQIRKVAAQLGHPVIRLHRTAIGEIQLNSASLPPLGFGQFRELSGPELAFLKSRLQKS